MPTSFHLGLETCADSGQLLRMMSGDGRSPILDCGAGAELRVNDLPLSTRVERISESEGEHLTVLRAEVPLAYGSGASLRVRRMISLGGCGLRPGTGQSAHIRYEITRVPREAADSGLDYIWQPPLEASLRLDTVTVLGAPMRWFGEKTRMRALAIGGTGPREHVSLEDGPVASVVPWLQTGFRSEFPGQLSANGALYYHPDTEQWVWFLARRPTTTGRILFDETHIAYRFGYHKDLPLLDEVWTPAVSLFWGQGLDEADKLLASQFDLCESPPDWCWKSVWFWLHPPWTKGVDYAKSAEAVKLLSGECGVNGYGIFAHDLPLSGNDCDMHSPAPSPVMGGHEGMRGLVETIRAHQGHSYAWISRHGFRPDSLRYNPRWSIRGIDGRNIRLRGQPSQGVSLDILDPADPDFRAYIKGWIAHYVRVLGIDGLFWDSGFQPLPPDFGDKPYLRWPGECNAHAQTFFEDMLRFGQSLSPDFFMWGEGISLDIPMNWFSVDARRHGEHSGNAYMQRLAHLAPRRLMWRSHWPHDLASGFVMLNPMNDVGLSFKDYKAIAADPMNQWVCRTVRERGVRHAVGLGDGLSRLDEFIVASPRAAAKVTVPDAPSKVLRHVIRGTRVQGVASDAGTLFDLPEDGAYSFE